MSRVRIIITVVFVLASMAWAAPTSAQGAGDALCAEALAAANGGASRFQGYQIVRAPAQGGSGAQVVLGTDGPDVLQGGSGNDLLCGFGAGRASGVEDRLYGGSGNDILVGGSRVDELYGESGGDTLYGSVGEFLDGGTGNNTLVVGPAPQVAVTLGPLGGGFCGIDFTVSGGIPNAEYDVDFVLIDPDGSDNDAFNFRFTDANGNFSDEVLIIEQGSTLVSAEVTLNETGFVVASFDFNQVCGP